MEIYLHDIKKKINNIHGNDEAANQVIIYGNLCTMQIILLHWDDLKLTSPAKKRNAPVIQRLLGIVNYKARADQRKLLFDNVTKDNYISMKNRVENLIDDDTKVSSSNFGKFLNHFSNDDMWINEINNKLEQC